MAAYNESYLPFIGSIESTFRQSAQVGLIVAGDLTSEAAAKAAVDVAAAKLHVSMQPLANAAKAAIAVVDDYVTGATTGSSLANIYSGILGDWAIGFPVNA